MAAIAVTATGKNNLITNGNRFCVRTSAGRPYVVVHNDTDNDIEIYKADANTPTSFSEQDAADNPNAAVYGSVSCAIDSTDVIHVVFVSYISKSDDLCYATFTTATDQWSAVATINNDLGGESTSTHNLYTSIAIDANNIPHVAYVGVEANAGTVGKVLRYENRIGGAWNGTGVEIEGQTGNKDCISPDITIDENNIPCVSYLNDDDDDLAQAIGNANDATSFTLTDIDASALSGSNTSICCDSSGNLYKAGVDSDGTIMVYDNGNTQRDTGSTGSSPSLVANGTDIYIFYEDSNNDIVYRKSTDAGVNWDAAVAVETGTFNTAKAKWAFWVDNGSGGSLWGSNQLVDSYSETNQDSVASLGASPVPAQGYAQAFTNIAKSISSCKFYLYKSGNPTGNAVAKIYAITGTYGSSAKPTGSALGTSDNFDVSTLTGSFQLKTFTFSTPVTVTPGVYYCISIEYSGGDGSNYVNIGYDISSPSHSGNGASYSSSTWYNNSNDYIFYIYGTKRTSATELDYAFVDETASPDIWWNTLSLGGGGGTNMQINIGDTFKTVSAIKINIGDSWKEVTKAQVNIGDNWKTIF